MKVRIALFSTLVGHRRGDGEGDGGARDVDVGNDDECDGWGRDERRGKQGHLRREEERFMS